MIRQEQKGRSQPLREREYMPLHGIKIVTCEALLALPFGTQLLSDFGADVISVEQAAYREDSDTRWRLRTGRHKRRIAVNLRDSRGQEIVRRLAARADVFAENFRPGVVEKYKLGYEGLSALNPRLIYVSVSGFGHREVLESPLLDLASYGPIGEAIGGVAHSIGAPHEGAQAIALGDIVTTLFATIGTLIALRDRDRTGTGQYVDMSMADSLLALNERSILLHALSRLQGASDRGRAREEPLMTGWGSYDLTARDGRFVIVLIESSHWSKFSDVLDHPEWVVDPRIIDKSTRKAALAEHVVPVVSEWARRKSKFEIARLFQEAGLAAAPVLTPEDILVEPHFAARRMLVDVVDELGAHLKVVGNPVKLSKIEANRKEETARIAAPGEHTVQILQTELGMANDEINALLNVGIVKEGKS